MGKGWALGINGPESVQNLKKRSMDKKFLAAQSYIKYRSFKI